MLLESHTGLRPTLVLIDRELKGIIYMNFLMRFQYFYQMTEIYED